MILRGIDEDWAKVDPVLAKQQGFGFIVGYVSKDNTGKNLTRDDVARIHAAGLAVAFVSEYNPSAALGGYSAGVADAQVAVTHFRDLGVPGNIACYSAGTDFNVQPGQMAVCMDFEKGFANTMAGAGYRYGVYTGYPFGLYLTQRNYDGFLWQTYAWSNGAWLHNAALRQVQNGVHIAGTNVDIDESESIDFGQWNGDTMSAYVFNLGSDVDTSLGMVPNAQYGGGPSGFFWFPTPEVRARWIARQGNVIDLGDISYSDAQNEVGPFIPWKPVMGPQGEKGDPGPKGDAAVLEAGTTLVVQ